MTEKRDLRQVCFKDELVDTPEKEEPERCDTLSTMAARCVALHPKLLPRECWELIQQNTVSTVYGVLYSSAYKRTDPGWVIEGLYSTFEAARRRKLQLNPAFCFGLPKLKHVAKSEWLTTISDRRPESRDRVQIQPFLLDATKPMDIIYSFGLFVTNIRRHVHNLWRHCSNPGPFHFLEDVFEMSEKCPLAHCKQYKLDEPAWAFSKHVICVLMTKLKDKTDLQVEEIFELIDQRATLEKCLEENDHYVDSFYNDVVVADSLEESEESD
jgi:hypothetical protein